MFNPIETLSGLLGMLVDIVGTSLGAMLVPTMSLLVQPLLSILTLFT
jgi:hypothetical protein